MPAKKAAAPKKKAPAKRKPSKMDNLRLGRNFYRIGERFKLRADIFEIVDFTDGGLVIEPLDKE